MQAGARARSSAWPAEARCVVWCRLRSEAWDCCVVWCGVVWCGVVWCGVVWCGVVWCGVVWCRLRSEAWDCCVVWCGVAHALRLGTRSLLRVCDCHFMLVCFATFALWCAVFGLLCAVLALRCAVCCLWCAVRLCAMRYKASRRVTK